ncbi:MAG TPA: addiction module protein [Opitutaceae bacterium]|nr:addiction module protein [Opitutaceae bacterium]
MIPSQITKTVLALPESERLELARRIVESVSTERETAGLIADGVRRIEDVASGKVRGLSEEEYRRKVG